MVLSDSYPPGRPADGAPNERRRADVAKEVKAQDVGDPGRFRFQFSSAKTDAISGMIFLTHGSPGIQSVAVLAASDAAFGAYAALMVAVLIVAAIFQSRKANSDRREEELRFELQSAERRADALEREAQIESQARAAEQADRRKELEANIQARRKQPEDEEGKQRNIYRIAAEVERKVALRDLGPTNEGSRPA